MKTLKQGDQREVARHFRRKIRLAGLAELEAIDRKLQRHYNAGTLSVEDYRALSIKPMEEISKFDCIK